MADEPDPQALESLRRETESRLSELLERRGPDARVAVLGAGSDDLDSGRAYLKLLAEGGFAVPTWPVEYGGMGLGKTEANVVRSVLAEWLRRDPEVLQNPAANKKLYVTGTLSRLHCL